MCLKSTGPSCSKLMMSLVKVLLKLCSLNMAYILIFLLKKKKKKKKKKMSSSFLSAKLPVNKVLYLLEQLTF